MVFIGIPCGFIFRCGLIAPHGPALPVPAGKQLKKRPWRASLDQRDEFVRFSGVLPLLCPQQVHLGPGRGQRPVPAAPDTKEQNFRHIPEVEPHTPAVRFSVLANLLPDDIALVLDSRRNGGCPILAVGIRKPCITDWEEGYIDEHNPGNI